MLYRSEVVPPNESRKRARVQPHVFGTGLVGSPQPTCSFDPHEAVFLDKVSRPPYQPPALSSLSHDALRIDG